MFSRDSKKQDELLRSELQEFAVLFPSEEHCLEAIFQVLFPDGQMLCRHCNGQTEARSFGSRYAYCLNCRKSSWVTANTPFHGARKLRARLATIWLMEKGVALNSGCLQRVLEVPLSTAWSIFQSTVAIAAKEMLVRFPLVQVGNFASIIFRRTKESLASEHPRAELEKASERENQLGENLVSAEIQEFGSGIESSPAEMPPAKDSAQLDIDSTRTDQGEVLKLLQSGQVSFDRLCELTGMDASQLAATLTLLEIEGSIERLSGDRYRKKALRKGCRSSLSASLLLAIDKCKTVLKTCFQGVSLKYLQNYLVFVWIHSDRASWVSGQLLKSICDAPKPINRELFHGSSPGLVAVFSDS